MSDAMQRRLAHVLATGISYSISHWVVDRFVDVPERKGMKDDVLKGATTAVSTSLAWVTVRGVLALR